MIQSLSHATIFYQENIYEQKEMINVGEKQPKVFLFCFVLKCWHNLKLWYITRSLYYNSMLTNDIVNGSSVILHTTDEGEFCIIN